MLQIGKLTVHLLNDGPFLLDGGSMFGMVPKVLWQKLCEPDELNRVVLAMNSLLIRSDKKLILIETGIGRKLGEKQRRIYGFSDRTSLLKSLSSVDVAPEDIDVVINTHLHLDHCGWNTMLDESGSVTPTFPNARYVIQRGEWEAAMNPNELGSGSYLKENFEPLEAAGQLDLIDGEEQITPHLRVQPWKGHTDHHQIVILDSEGCGGVYIGDIVPTSAHLRAAYVTAFDASAQEILESKREIVRQALEQDWILFYPHDAKIPASRLSPPQSDREFAVASSVEI